MTKPQTWRCLACGDQMTEEEWLNHMTNCTARLVAGEENE